MTEQFSQVHELLARNTALLSQDRGAIGGDALRVVEDIGAADHRPLARATAAADDRPRRATPKRRRP